MPRIPSLGDDPLYQRSRFAEIGRGFTEGIRREQEAQLKLFMAGLRAPHAGPAGPKPVKYQPEDNFHTRELARLGKAHMDRLFPKRPVCPR